MQKFESFAFFCLVLFSVTEDHFSVPNRFTERTAWGLASQQKLVQVSGKLNGSLIKYSLSFVYTNDMIGAIFLKDVAYNLRVAGHE